MAHWLLNRIYHHARSMTPSWSPEHTKESFMRFVYPSSKALQIFFVSSFLFIPFIFFCVHILHAEQVKYEYDAMHRLTKVSHSRATIEYSYDSNGNRLLKSVRALCPGDLDFDGNVNFSDLKLFVKDFGRTDCIAGSSCPADFDADGDVDAFDLRMFKADFGRKDCNQCP